MKEKNKYNLFEMKCFIIERFKKKNNIDDKLRDNIDEIISNIVDFDEIFLDQVMYPYSNDEEINFIKMKTGHDFNFVEKVLWQRYCYEMKKGMWIYNADICLNCNKEELIFREIIDVEYGEKIVCQNCGCEMVIGPEGLEEYN